MITTMSVLETPTGPQRTASLKRKRGDNATVSGAPQRAPEPATPPAKTKRPRTTDGAFDGAVRTQAWVNEFTRKALEEHAHGRDTAYNTLKRIFTPATSKRRDVYVEEDGGGEVAEEELGKYVLALRMHTHAVGRDAGGLLSAAMNCRWLERDERFVVGFQSFLLGLLSCHGGYVPHVVKWLIGKFATGKAL
jgi:RNA polymerase I-specific transcription initiation factor RRN3